jgi:hypothetical protein
MDLYTFLTSVTSSVILAGGVAWLTKTWLTEKIRQDLTSHYAHKIEEYKAELRANVDAQLETKKAELRANVDAQLETKKAELRANVDAQLETKKAELRANVDAQLEERRAELKTKVDTGLELLRDQLTQLRTLQTAATNALASAHAASTERRLEAIEELWKTLFKLRTGIGGMVVYLEILTPAEITRAHEDPRMAPTLKDLTRERIDSILTPTHNSEEWRPFVGEAIWAYFYGYRAFLGRLAMQYVISFQKERRIKHWQNDILVQKILASLLSKSEIEQIKSAPLNQMQRATELIEAKFFSLTQEVISGQSASEHLLTQTRRIYEAAATTTQSIEGWG